MEYFGTDLTEHGHYRFVVDEKGNLVKNWKRFDDLPFHPEYLTNNLPKGEVVFYQSAKFTVLAIAGSCVDERPGTTSVFWEQEILTKEQMIAEILTYPVFIEIIAKMKFKVKW